MSSDKILILGCKGCGSAIAEAFLTLASIPYDREEVNYDEPGPARDRLIGLNPLGQVPTLLFPDGSVLTETLAIAQYVHDRAPLAGLIPFETPDRIRFWRWATFLIAAVYPTFTYGDSPHKWLTNADAQNELRASTDARREELYGVLEHQCRAPYFLGERFSAIDVYLGAMVHWRPRPPWFEANTPRMAAVARKVKSRPELAGVWASNFE